MIEVLLEQFLKNNDIEINKKAHAIMTGNKVAAYDIKTGKQIQVFLSQYKAGEWIQSLGKPR